MQSIRRLEEHVVCCLFKVYPWLGIVLELQIKALCNVLDSRWHCLILLLYKSQIFVSYLNGSKSLATVWANETIHIKILVHCKKKYTWPVHTVTDGLFPRVFHVWPSVDRVWKKHTWTDTWTAFLARYTKV